MKKTFRPPADFRKNSARGDTIPGAGGDFLGNSVSILRRLGACLRDFFKNVYFCVFYFLFFIFADYFFRKVSFLKK